MPRRPPKKTPPSSPIRSFGEALDLAVPRPAASASREDKKNYAERLSRGIATWVARALRPHFKGVTPTDDGRQQESRARTGKGTKKLDVNYSTPELGLGLGVSVKTVNFRDPKTNRYTKNYTRIDNELRAEALDYHVRQPYATLVAVVFMPADACDDAYDRGPARERGISSFGGAVRILRHRAGRVKPSDEEQLFEQIFIGLYSVENRDVAFFDVMSKPPRAGRPVSVSFEKMIEQVELTYDRRNDPPFEWAD
jgi:hypothetical protein